MCVKPGARELVKPTTSLNFLNLIAELVAIAVF